MTLTFVLSLVLIPYGLAVAAVAVFAAFNLHHLVQHGAAPRLSYAITLIFLIGSAAILLTTWQELRSVDWRQPVSLTQPATHFGPPEADNADAP